MTDPLLPQAVSDTLGVVTSDAYVRIVARRDLLWVAVWPFLLGVYMSVQAVVAMGAAILDKCKLRTW